MKKPLRIVHIKATHTGTLCGRRFKTVHVMGGEARLKLCEACLDAAGRAESADVRRKEMTA